MAKEIKKNKGMNKGAEAFDRLLMDELRDVKTRAQMNRFLQKLDKSVVSGVDGLKLQRDATVNQKELAALQNELSSHWIYFRDELNSRLADIYANGTVEGNEPQMMQDLHGHILNDLRALSSKISNLQSRGIDVSSLGFVMAMANRQMLRAKDAERKANEDAAKHKAEAEAENRAKKKNQPSIGKVAGTVAAAGLAIVAVEHIGEAIANQSNLAARKRLNKRRIVISADIQGRALLQEEGVAQTIPSQATMTRIRQGAIRDETNKR